MFGEPERRAVQWLLRRLRVVYRRRTFTTRQAEDLYVRERRPAKDAGWGNRPGDDGWVRMNARNALCCAVQLGLLVRLRRGVYQFVKGGKV